MDESIAMDMECREYARYLPSQGLVPRCALHLHDRMVAGSMRLFHARVQEVREVYQMYHFYIMQR